MKTYLELRAEMLRQGVEQKYLARKLARSIRYVSDRFCRRAPWSIDDAYLIMSILHLPADQIYRYFPPNGIAS
mgnify:CR=1 FL=1|jgi:hypothetical protein|nr:MAG TPA: Regulatory protein-modification, helix-turn-helix, transcriptional regulato, DNA [Bacteriophage sp.]